MINYDSFSVISISIEEIDFIKTPKLSAEIVKKLEEIDYPNVVLVFDGLYYIDSTGMSSLINISRTMSERKREMVLVCGNSRIIQLFGIAKMGTYFKIFNNMEDAERYFITKPAP